VPQTPDVLEPPFRQLGIVGLGLIGGSIAAAASAAWPRLHVIGVDRPEIAADARGRGWIHEVRARSGDLGDADLVVLAAPVPGIVACLGDLARAGHRSTVTDVGSTKRTILQAAADAGLAGFVGGHPMAGAEASGLAAARADLFAGHRWHVVPGERAGDDDVARVEALASGVGARPTRTDAETHDRVMAYVSHLPQLLAVALMNTAGGAVGGDGLAMAGRGLADMTRLASSPPAVWEGILAANADYVAEALDALRVELTGFDAREPGATDLSAPFARAAAFRKVLLEVMS
jgi:prephenate dehydrogenase